MDGVEWYDMVDGWSILRPKTEVCMCTRLFVYIQCASTIPRSDGSVHGSYFWMNAPLPVAQLSSMLWCTLDSTLWTNNRHTKPTNIEPLFKTLLLENWMVIRKDVISCMKQRCMIVNCKLSSLDFHLKSRTLIAASKKNFESGAMLFRGTSVFRSEGNWHGGESEISAGVIGFQFEQKSQP